MQRRRRRQRLPCALRAREYLRQLVAFLFSNVGVIVLVVGYIIAGAFIFQAIEGSSEIERVQSMTRERQLAADRLWRHATLRLNVFDERSWKRKVTAELALYQNTVVKAVRRGWSGDDIGIYRQWSFPGSFLYSLTIITTIGYGNIAPRTDWGKVTTICYAMIGMPLFLLYLTNLGDLLARSFKWFYASLCLCRGCPGVAKRRAIRLRMQIQAQLGEPVTPQEPSERRRSAPESRTHRRSESPLRLPRVDSSVPDYGIYERYFPENKARTIGPDMYCSRLKYNRRIYNHSRHENSEYYRRDTRRYDQYVRTNHTFYDRKYFGDDEVYGREIPSDALKGNNSQRYAISKHTQRHLRENNKYRHYNSGKSHANQHNARYCEGNDESWYSSKNLSRPIKVMDDSHSTEEENDPIDNYGEFVDTCSVDSDFTYITIDTHNVAVPITICVFIMVGYIFFGAMMFTLWEEWDRVDGSYFCFISLTSIGFGDIVPGERIYARASPSNKRIDTGFILCSMYLLFGMALVAMCFNLMQEQVMQYLGACRRVLHSIVRCRCCRCR